MKTLKSIEHKIRKTNSFRKPCYRSSNGQTLFVLNCAVAKKCCYNYYDKEIPPFKFDTEWEYLKDDHRIEIIRCDDCCGCGDW